MAMPQLLGTPQLLGLGASEPIDAFLLAHPSPSATEISEFLKAFSIEQRGPLAQALIARGVDSSDIASALRWLEASDRVRGNWPTILGVLSIASAGASAYHGYRRNQSLPWALWWFLMGSIFPVVTPVIALAQGFGKRKGA